MRRIGTQHAQTRRPGRRRRPCSCPRARGSHSAGSVLPATAAPQSASAPRATPPSPCRWAGPRRATHAATIPGATDKGALAPSTPLTVRVGLNLRNAGRLQSAVAAGQADHAPAVRGRSTARRPPRCSPSSRTCRAKGSQREAGRADRERRRDRRAGGEGVRHHAGVVLARRRAGVRQHAARPRTGTSLGGVVSAVLGLSRTPARCPLVRPQPAFTASVLDLSDADRAVPRRRSTRRTSRSSTMWGMPPTGSLTTVAVHRRRNVSQVSATCSLPRRRKACRKSLSTW